MASSLLAYFQLYHIPPAIVRKFGLGEIKAMKGDKSWLSRMSKFNESDGSGIQGKCFSAGLFLSKCLKCVDVNPVFLPF